jgi:hypothetical protein
VALNNVTIVKSQGGLGRPLAGFDFVSGMVFYTSTLPSGFTSTYNKQPLSSLVDAENLGITNTYSDETAAEAEYEITASGATGDTGQFVITEPTIETGVTRTVDLGTYTVGASDTTIDLQGAAWVAVINAGTVTHGYSATYTAGTDTITIIARTGLGIALNSGTPIADNVTGTLAGTLTQFAGGVATKLGLWHYHISEYFRIQPRGKVWVGFYPVPSSYTFVEMNDLQNFAQGEIRQILVYNDVARTAANIVSDCTALQAAQVISEGLKMPYEVLYAASANYNINGLLNLNTLTAYKVSVVISQDAGGQGAFLYLTTGKGITTGGACLGMVSLLKVSENIGWVERCNVSNGVECDTIGFVTGQSWIAQSENTLNQLNSYRYIFLRKYTSLAGSYFNDSHTAVSVASDFAYIENNRTIDKAGRLAYTALLPQLNSPLTLNADGTLTNVTIAAFTGLLTTAINDMVRNGELSAFLVTIDPNQDVLTTSTIVVRLQLLINGVARNIIVNIGFTTSL